MEEHKRQGWEMWVRMDKILCTVLREAHERQVEETMGALEEGPEGSYKRPSRSRTPPPPGVPGVERVGLVVSTRPRPGSARTAPGGFDRRPGPQPPLPLGGATIGTASGARVAVVPASASSPWSAGRPVGSSSAGSSGPSRRSVLPPVPPAAWGLRSTKPPGDAFGGGFDAPRAATVRYAEDPWPPGS